MSEIEAWIITQDRIKAVLYYTGAKVPSIRTDMFTGDDEQYVDVTFTTDIRKATLFDTREEATYIGVLVYTETGFIQVQIKKVKVIRKE